MIKIDTRLPVASPLRPNAAKNPVTEYEFRTDVFTSENGREQRVARRARPRVTVKYECLAYQPGHAQACIDFFRTLGGSAIALPDFRLLGAAVAVPGSGVVVMHENECVWPIGTTILIQSMTSLAGHVAVVAGYDPVGGSIQIDPPIPASFPANQSVSVGSCISASLSDISVQMRGPSVLTVAVEATIFPQEAQLLGVTTGNLVFPLRHGDAAPMSFDASKKTRVLDYERGAVFEFKGEDFRVTGTRTYDLTALQLSQSDKDAAVGFFSTCKGRCKAFSVPEGVIPGNFGSSTTRHRFASDILSVEHIDAHKSRISTKIVEIPA